MALYINNLIKEKNKQFNNQYLDYYNIVEDWNYSLYKITKSNKGFIPEKGDIFLIQPIKGLYFYGKVLEIHNEGESGKDYFACCLIFNCKTTKISIEDFLENYKNVIGVNEKISLISSLFFQNGKIVVVGNTHLDNNIKYGFLEQVGWYKNDSNSFDEKKIVKDDTLVLKNPDNYRSICKCVDYDGEELNYVPEFYCEHLSFITEHGLLVLFYKEYFINSELFSLNGFKFNASDLFSKKKLNKNNLELLPFKVIELKNGLFSIILDVCDYAHKFKNSLIEGNGYDIERLFMAFLNSNNFVSDFSIIMDSEADCFIASCKSKEYLIDIILKFKKVIENENDLLKLVYLIEKDE